jgi:hypothetical protein
MKSILFFDLLTKDRRRIEKSIGTLDQFAGRVWRTIVRDDDRAREIIRAAHEAARVPLRFLVIDEAEFAAGWGVITQSAVFGGPFSQ